MPGNAATSRVEGAHAYMKSYIGGSAADILTVFELTAKGLLAQHNAINAKLQSERIRRPIFGDKVLFAALYRQITHHALRRLDDEFQRIALSAETGLPPCTNRFTGVFGLPCMHRMRALKAQGWSIPLEEVHPFWRIAHFDLPFRSVSLGPIWDVGVDVLTGRRPIFDPDPPAAATLRRELNNAAQRQERRNPSQFEIIDMATTQRVASQQQSAQQSAPQQPVSQQPVLQQPALQQPASQQARRRAPTCSCCGSLGHTARTCVVRRL